MIVKKFKTSKYFEVARIVQQSMANSKKPSTQQSQHLSINQTNSKQRELSTKESSSNKNSHVKNRNVMSVDRS